MLLSGLLDRILLVVGVVAGGCIPGFVLQYRQRVGGRLDQVSKDLAPFQEIANQQHGGSLSALVRHHMASTDQTFVGEGMAIQKMIDALASLRDAVAALNGDMFHQIAYLARHGDLDIARATWSTFSPTFVLTAESLMIAAVVGLSLWLGFLALWFGTAWVFRRVRFALS